MEAYKEAFVGLDTSKLKISVAVAEGERDGEVRFFGDISSEAASIASMVAFPSGRTPRSKTDAAGPAVTEPSTAVQNKKVISPSKVRKH